MQVVTRPPWFTDEYKLCVLRCPNRDHKSQTLDHTQCFVKSPLVRPKRFRVPTSERLAVAQ
eukprot:9481074-Pyramimonas_sp.AAC.1